MVTSSEGFGSIYHILLQKYFPRCPDRRDKDRWLDWLYIIDSTTISLFKEILKCVGSKPVSGKRKWVGIGTNRWNRSIYLWKEKLSVKASKRGVLWKKDKVLVFLGNIFSLSGDEAAEIYQKRWKIEYFFKRLKHNFPFEVFFGWSPEYDWGPDWVLPDCEPHLFGHTKT